METEKKNSKELGLKHLGFVRVAAIHVLVSLSSLYDYAKQNSGPLKPAVGKVEGAVTTVVTPVFNKFKDVPDTLLLFLDHKVNPSFKSSSMFLIGRSDDLVLAESLLFLLSRLVKFRTSLISMLHQWLRK